jgi:hypothetical protein
MTGPIPISRRILGSKADVQNRTAEFIWRPLRRWGSFLLADAVGTGKSYVALSLALGSWRAQRGRIFRFLVLAPTSELSDSWFHKIAGRPKKDDLAIGSLAAVPGAGSFLNMYMPKGSRRPREFVVYQIRMRSHIEAVRDALRSKQADALWPGRRPKGGRVECLITSPAFITGLRRNGPEGEWRKWISRTDFVIADEVFQAKNEWTKYGRLLRDKRFGFWPGRRPPLIGLSATLLSRDLPDAQSILEMALAWGRKGRERKRLSEELGPLLRQFRQRLGEGLKKRAPSSRAAYKEVAEKLERQLGHVLVRALPHRKRSLPFWAAGHLDRRVAPVELQQFPVPNARMSILLPLQERLVKAKGAGDGLAWFLRRPPAINGTPNSVMASQYRSWTAVTESSARGDKSRHPKIESLLQWLERHYEESERQWLAKSSRSSFRYKVLVYVHHVKTAGELNPLSRSRIARDAARDLNRRLLSTCIRLAKLMPDIFRHGQLDSPTPQVERVLDDHGWSIDTLKRRNRTLLLSALVNAHRATKEERLRSVARTVAGEERESETYRAKLVIQSSSKLRELVFRDHDQIVAFDRGQRRNRGRMISTALLDLDVLEEAQRRQLLRKLAIAKEDFRNLLAKDKEVVNEGRIEEIADILRSAIEAEPSWESLVRRANRRPEQTLQKLLVRRAQLKQTHKEPGPIAALTGQDSANRNFMTARFRGPGNPFVLVLTHVCQLGVDLHPFCWDVVHYSPAWTPHEGEQKTGRIDRPRLPSTLKQLDLGSKRDADAIRVHHLIWPFTYDERILTRLNVRAQYAERLLGSRVRSDSEDEAARALRHFKPLELSVAARRGAHGWC